MASAFSSASVRHSNLRMPLLNRLFMKFMQKVLCLPYFLFFRFLNYTHFTHAAASSTVIDDVRKLDHT